MTRYFCDIILGLDCYPSSLRQLNFITYGSSNGQDGLECSYCSSCPLVEGKLVEVAGL